MTLRKSAWMVCGMVVLVGGCAGGGGGRYTAAQTAQGREGVQQSLQSGEMLVPEAGVMRYPADWPELTRRRQPEATGQ